MKSCTTCRAELYSRNRSGYCRAHVNGSPEARAKNSLAQSRALALNPELRESRREAGRKGANLPGERQRRSVAAKAQNLSKIGRSARDSLSFEKLSRSVSATRMAWCPPELRDEARRLTAGKRLPLAEVKEIILAQHERDIARFRAKLDPTGATVPTNVVPILPAPQIDPASSFAEQIIAIVAWHLGSTPGDITGESRLAQHVRPRHAAAMAFRMGGLSMQKIGRALGGRDHTTIRSSLFKAERLMESDAAFAAAVNAADEFEVAA